MDLDQSNNNSGHGQWQKVVNIKKQRRQETKDVKKTGKPDVVSQVKQGSDRKSVFTALDEASEARRLRILANKPQRYEEDGDDDDVSLGSQEEDGDLEERLENGKVEEDSKKAPKLKKPKVTVSAAASSIDTSELTAFLTEIGVSSYSPN